MGAIRRFSALDEDNSVFIFTIDTTLINPSGTDGSENPLTFVLPLHDFSVQSVNNFILRVSDGRPDVSVVGQAQTLANRQLSFASPGVYTVTIIGTIGDFSFFRIAIDRLKITEINRWGSRITFVNAFYSCTNLMVKATNPILLDGSNSRNMFREIIGFETKEAVSALITNQITDAVGMFWTLQEPLKWMPNAFWSAVPTFNITFFGTEIDASVDVIEIISDTLTTVVSMFYQTSSSPDVRLVMRTPNLASIDRLWYGVASPAISFGEVDIRSLTSCNRLFDRAFPTAKIDATLLGWANNFDWSDVPSIPNKVTIDVNNNKYSNDPDVIAAKAFLEAKGYVFTNLTME